MYQKYVAFSHVRTKGSFYDLYVMYHNHSSSGVLQLPSGIWCNFPSEYI